MLMYIMSAPFVIKTGLNQPELRHFVLTRSWRRCFSRNGNNTRKPTSDGNEINIKDAASHNKLFQQIKARILTSGPITVADYMKEVLTNPTRGYYMNRDVFGKEGDFVTSPEISQMFGELIAIWFANEWTKLGKPKPLQIAELGPGRGTLMSDILRVFAKLKLLDPADLSVAMVEISQHLSGVQQERLCGGTVDSVKDGEDGSYRMGRSIHQGCEIRWFHHLPDVPRSPFTLFLAHEFFDALPVHKLVHVEGKGWREVLIDLEPDQPGRLRYVLSRERTPACLYRHEQETRKELEVSPQSLVIIQEMAARIHQGGGIGLIVDYGHEGDKTYTFRAFRNHQLHDPLIEPGSADLTADVDFAALKRAVRHSSNPEEWKALVTFGTVDQASFLNKMGIQVRLDQLVASCGTNEDGVKLLKSAHQMLTDPAGMGGKFKVLSLFPGVMEGFLSRYPPHGFT